jgi:putative tryptophan/tyrosine transport system substrate-binding protein
MRRVWVVATLTVVLLAAPLAAEAQTARRPIVGVTLFGSSPSPYAQALQQRLVQLGWVDGQNIRLEYRYAEGQPERFPGFVAEFLRLRVDVIVAGGGTNAAQTAKRATNTIPIVVPLAADPVAAGLVVSLARPGGNTRGEEFEKALEAARRVRAEALVVCASAFFNSHRQRLVDLAQQKRLAAIYEHRDFAEAGGLMSYGPNIVEAYRSTATYVDKVLKGAKPADLPVEQPTKFELVINLKTAKALGLTIPPSVRARADEVIQ